MRAVSLALETRSEGEEEEVCSSSHEEEVVNFPALRSPPVSPPRVRILAPRTVRVTSKRGEEKGKEDEGKEDPQEEMSRDLKAAKQKAELLSGLVREEEARIEEQRQQMIEMEIAAEAREAQVRAVREKLLEESKKLSDLEKERKKAEIQNEQRLRKEAAEIEKDAAEARRAATAAKIAEMDRVEAARFEAEASERRKASTVALKAIEEKEARRIAEASKAKREAASRAIRDLETRQARSLAQAEAAASDKLIKLQELEAKNLKLEQRYEALERERAQREAQLKSTASKYSTRTIGPNHSLCQLLEHHLGGPLSPTSILTSKRGEPFPDVHGAAKENELPLSHELAAEGRAVELTALPDEAFSALDAVQRAPLFYACTQDRVACVELLLVRAPQTAPLQDANGDTSLHAAVSAGAVKCARSIISTLPESTRKKFVTTQNKLGMHAAHLAASVPCLELLLEFGATFIATDHQGRTPLYVACAMNRFECATMLLELIDLEDSQCDLSQPDANGDTALHAAACNGAEACVRLLLESGCHCDMTNHQKQRPLDLAVKREHTGCRRLLAEYHLHHSTQSDFDSVLFLASLEGHKTCKDLLRRNKYGTPIASSSSSSGGLDRTFSRYSLRRGKSMKLVQWGSWIAYEDPEQKDIFWYNQLSGQGQWNKPEAVAQAEMKCKANDNDPKSKTDTAKWESLRKTSMRLAQIGDWLQYREKGNGRPFFYHPETGDFSWDPPPEFAKASTKKNSSAGPASSSPGGLSPSSNAHWIQYHDPETAAPFWYNEVTGVSTWELPPLSTDNAVTTINEEEDDEDQAKRDEEETTKIVDNVNDLGI